MSDKVKNVIDFIQNLYQTVEVIPLHEPKFIGNEKAYLMDCIDSTFVSSVGKYVDQFEKMVIEATGINHAIATVNGTAALHVALELVGVKPGDEVVTQPLSFIATCNAITYCGAKPVFVDVDRETLGMSPQSLKDFLLKNVIRSANSSINKKTGKKISAVLPMHTFGHPCLIEDISEICDKFNIPLIEDAAESLGSYYKGRHTGSFGKVAIFSFNGNKTITSGGGGMIVTNDKAIALRAKHTTTTAKKPHPYEFLHDEIGYNYRLPNINAALGCAQMEKLKQFLEDKRAIADIYSKFFRSINLNFIYEPKHSNSNYWLNGLILENKEMRDNFLRELNDAGVMSRPIWRLMNTLKMFSDCECTDISNAKWLEERVINIPSSARFK